MLTGKYHTTDNKKGIDVVGPSHYGFDIEHRPIEKVVSL